MENHGDGLGQVNLLSSLDLWCGVCAGAWQVNMLSSLDLWCGVCVGAVVFCVMIFPIVNRSDT